MGRYNKNKKEIDEKGKLVDILKENRNGQFPVLSASPIGSDVDVRGELVGYSIEGNGYMRPIRVDKERTDAEVIQKKKTGQPEGKDTDLFEGHILE
jgi:hypothetical protein